VHRHAFGDAFCKWNVRVTGDEFWIGIDWHVVSPFGSDHGPVFPNWAALRSP
jgi:hypothetical protein